MAEDIKENEMQNGSPTLLRGLDAEGNSVVIPTRDLAGLIMSPYKIVSDIIHVPADKCLKIGSFSLDELGYGFSTKNRHKAQRKAKFYINKCRSASCMQSGWKRTSA